MEKWSATGASPRWGWGWHGKAMVPSPPLGSPSHQPSFPRAEPTPGLGSFLVVLLTLQCEAPLPLGLLHGRAVCRVLGCKSSRSPTDVSPIQMSCHPALKFCDANAKPSGRRAGPRPAPHSTGEKWRKNTFFFLNEKTNARNGHSWVKMNWAVRKRDTRLGRITF